MACKASFALHHNFPKIAEEAGFAFNTHRPRVHIEWNKIRLLDIESLIREKKFVLIEQHINDILDCVLESEFDVRILDEGVVKIFRLAQLAVEYQQFCRHYLDRSVYVLREEVTALAKELENYKRNLREKEDEMRRLRKKSYHYSRTSLPVTNENIATMILSSLKNQSDIFSSAAHLDTLRNNKCQYCDKVFLNHLYLKSHLSRRHPNVTEVPQKDIVNDINTQNNLDENYKLHSEIENLKSKLSEMEVMMSQTYKSNNLPESDKQMSKEEKNYKKELKDAEVLTQSDEFLENRLDDYRKNEFEKYDKELSFLRTQITQLVDAEKNKKIEINVENDDKKIEKLQATIEQQSEELVTLKQELLHSKYMKDTIESEKQREIELQMAHWATKAEDQSNECKMLLQKLNDSTKEVHEYKVLAEREREKALKLQELLDKQQRTVKTNNLIDESPINQNNHVLRTETKSKKSRPTPDRASLEKLQKQAQDLLNIVQSTTDLSSSSEASNNIPEPKVNYVKYEKTASISNTLKRGDNMNHYEKKFTSNKKEIGRKTHHSKLLNGKRKNKKIKNTEIKENGHITVPVSPIKVVRAKVTEEVNQRLIQLGVDPLKKRLPKNTFQKQRTMLQKQQELKVKKYPSREKIYHCILTHLDTNTTLPQGLSQKTGLTRNSPGKTKFFSLASVISNVKTKALSLVKSNEALYKKNTNNPMTIRAPALLKTPPSSMQPSPTNLQEVTSPTRYEAEKNNTSKERIKKKVTLKNEEREVSSESDSTDDSETESEHVPKKYCKKILDVSINHQPTQSTPKKTTVDINKSQFISQVESDNKSDITNLKSNKEDLTSNDIESIENIVSPRKAFSEENLNPKQTKGVLRNASSTSSLNKKKVLFDMDAIQMKSISASPSQSLAEKSDDNEKYTLGIINLDAEDWDQSSTENENYIKPTIQLSTRTTPKIAELKQVIESQMARRIKTPSTVLVGSVNILPTPIPMARTSLGGSNTSLGSSILDESDNSSITNKNTSTTKNKAEKKDDSEIDFSELLADDKSNKF